MMSHQKKIRRVTFSSHNDVKEVVKNSIEEKSNCWYSAMDLANMRADVRTEATAFIKAFEIYGLDSITECSLLIPFRNSDVDRRIRILSRSQSCFRGLESFIFPEICRNRMMHVRSILNYHNRGAELIKMARLRGIPAVDIAIMKDNLRIRASIMCTNLSKWSMDKAQALAKYDATSTYSSSRRRSINEQLMNNQSSSHRESFTGKTMLLEAREQSTYGKKRKHNSDKGLRIHSLARSAKRGRPISPKSVNNFVVLA